jgi:glycerol uptake facilitator-like aquaporin
MTLGRRAAGEALATALLLATVIGSGVMGENLAQGNAAIALLANTLATGAMLVVLILVFGPISGAHMNPLVSVAEAWRGNLAWRDVPLYIAAQVAGAFAGVAAAHAMFAKPLFFASQHVRAGWPLVWSETVAAFGLLLTVLCISRTRPGAVPFAVGAYIAAAYWFTASTSFANPAVTLARAASDTFAGIRPDDVAGFLFGQMAGMVLAMLFYWWMYGNAARGMPSGAARSLDA